MPETRSLSTKQEKNRNSYKTNACDITEAQPLEQTKSVLKAKRGLLSTAHRAGTYRLSAGLGGAGSPGYSLHSVTRASHPRG